MLVPCLPALAIAFSGNNREASETSQGEAVCDNGKRRGEIKHMNIVPVLAAASLF